jgi:hypothetical protein
MTADACGGACLPQPDWQAGSTLMTLSGLCLSPESPYRRNLPKPIAHLGAEPEITEYFDYTTLSYAAIALPARDKIRLYGPPLFNLRDLVRAGTFRTNGTVAAIRKIRQYPRFSIIDLQAPKGGIGATLDFQHAGMTLEQPVFTADLARFKGHNVVYTMQRDNDLAWIVDWLRYYVRAHGATAVVIADNASTRYSPADLLRTIGGVEGISQAAVVSVPFRYGPRHKFARLSKGRYLQMSVQNAIRDMLLGAARAVISVDIDEIVVSRSGRSVFDVVASSPFGAFTIPGFWRVCNPDDGPVSFRTSVHIEDRTKEKSPPKYAVVPNSLLGQTPWAIHSLYYLPRWLLLSKEFWFAHCRHVSTNWGGDRPLVPLGPMAERDHALEAVLRRYFV